MGGHQIRETEGHSPEYSPALSSGISVHLETAVSELGVCGVVEGVIPWAGGLREGWNDLQEA